MFRNFGYSQVRNEGKKNSNMLKHTFKPQGIQIYLETDSLDNEQ